MENTYDYLLDELKEKRILAFGCGMYFRKFILRYPKLWEKVEMVLDNNKANGYYQYENRSIPVYNPDILKKMDVSEYVIIFFAFKWKGMKEQTDGILYATYSYFHYPFEVDYMKNKEINFYHRVAIPVIEELEKNDKLDKVLELYNLETKDILIEKIVKGDINSIPRVPIILTPKCSLRCKECNNLMWKFETYDDLSLIKIKKSLQELLECFDFFPSFELIGGEPFASKNLYPVLEFLVAQDKVLNIEITTNATILPNEQLINLLQSKKVIVKISDYSMVVNQTKFIECMKAANIKHIKLEFENWIATGGIEKRERDSAALIKQYYNCESGNLCKSLWEDKLYPCARAASLAQLHIYENCPYVDMSTPNKLRERIIHFFMVPTCGPCDYCNNSLEEAEFVEPAVQIKKD